MSEENNQENSSVTTSLTLPVASCSVCHRAEPPQPFSEDDDLAALVRTNVPGWQPKLGLCEACLAHFRAFQERLQTGDHIFRDGAYQILPTPLRVGADERFTGRGVTIAFLDSGFYPHPDLTEPENRVLRYVNILNKRASDEEFRAPNASSWHGMMTSVVATGNGHLSGGLYRGIASDARVVLVKVGSAARIRHDDIRRGLEWVIAHREEYGIRIVNISCGGDHEASYLTDKLSQAADAAVRAGMVVVCAAGNAGHTIKPAVLPPASSPAVITVGGLNDKNTLEFDDAEMYRSSYGPTIDGLQKPEVIAPSIWLAAPILPHTPTAAEAALLAKLKAASDHDLRPLLHANSGINAELDAARDLPLYLIRQLVEIKIHDANVISDHYKHVDGTSFAAPIVSSVAAQMLEANPRLSPQQVKLILMETAIRISDVPVERQGWGTIIPGRAVERALQQS
jgi:serine protease AprX